MYKNKERYFSPQEVEAIFQRASRLSLNLPEDYVSYSQLISIAEEIGISSLAINVAILDSQSALRNSNPAPTLTRIESSNYEVFALSWLKTILRILTFTIFITLSWKLILSSFELLQQHITIFLQPISSTSSLNINNIALAIFYYLGVIIIAVSKFFLQLLFITIFN
ncbi:MAG: hypothetical protein CLLPBCKN_007248 [Chroococcidiopsis cubana SAG 39.79]|uniref:Uncharacterized protein n=1 Tax=Chroococcidiopsis cubana SAG 39.79 TaxID=388085 RepID=A0AB37URL2_9CYAN|nr:hypothetical protein [Chroococcidiopsis cubana]MDZ4877813.1 hypothetical protein [Chroococcidiopsis cubana SAG 39.79]RUT14090.1 hypothetical protein DSM107010_05730 [Chroococcidiopsis cubana SAG 39.79]